MKRPIRGSSATRNTWIDKSGHCKPDYSGARIIMPTELIPSAQANPFPGFEPVSGQQLGPQAEVRAFWWFLISKKNVHYPAERCGLIRQLPSSSELENALVCTLASME